jgi:hypothetical protein
MKVIIREKLSQQLLTAVKQFEYAKAAKTKKVLLHPINHL